MNENNFDPISIFNIIPVDFWIMFVVVTIIYLVFRALELYFPQKEFKYLLRKHRVEVMTLIFAISGYIFSYLFLEKPQIILLISFLITFFSVIFVVYSKFNEKDFYFLPFRREKEKEDWIGEGAFGYERIDESFLITQSDSGFIFAKSLVWNNYYVDFEFKIIKHSLGVILRAANLSNLVMIQIFEDRIKPHIRINGFWRWWDEKESGLVFEKKLSLDSWYRAIICCDRKSVKIKIYNTDDKIIIDREWMIPSGNISFQNRNDENEIISSMFFPINLEYGSFGFRNHGEEKALVKNVLVEKIQGNKIIKYDFNKDNIDFKNKVNEK